jgi:hypothetical protein
MRLRPVAFRYKADTSGIQQHGLIAEEVAKVYPELVVNGADGKPETVAYHVPPAMLLNEVQKRARELAQKDAQITAQQRQLESQQRTLVAAATASCRPAAGAVSSRTRVRSLDASTRSSSKPALRPEPLATAR